MTKSMQTQYNFKLIDSEAEYNQALKRMEELFSVTIGSDNDHEANLLALIIEDYEEQHYKIPSPDPIEAIRIRMEEMDLKQRDLVDIFGSKGIVSEILNRKRKLTVKMVRNISNRLKIGTEILVQDYKLNI